MKHTDRYHIIQDTMLSGELVYHDDGTLIQYIENLGLGTDVDKMIIRETARFYDVEFSDGVLFVVSNHASARRDIKNAINTIIEYFETLRCKLQGGRK